MFMVLYNLSEIRNFATEKESSFAFYGDTKHFFSHIIIN